ncbi:TPA: hypothetical protein ACH7S0_005178, partial [Escherichia coli]
VFFDKKNSCLTTGEIRLLLPRINTEPNNRIQKKQNALNKGSTISYPLYFMLTNSFMLLYNITHLAL